MTNLKNILITSGGTLVPIDDVRFIGNFSSGRFPSQLAEEALLSGHEVYYIYARGAMMPFADFHTIDSTKPLEPQFQKITEFNQRHKDLANHLHLFEFQTIDDYAHQIRHILENHKIDIAFLAAAVSDFIMSPVQGKISSRKKNLILHLKQGPKIISQVKAWSPHPIFQVGFKLLSNVSKEELIDAAYRSGLENGSNLTVANDLSALRAGKIGRLLITSEKGVIEMDSPNPAKEIIAFVTKRAQAHYFKSLVFKNTRLSRKYKNEINALNFSAHRLSNAGFFPPFYPGHPSSHGSLTLKTNSGSFLITCRGSNKKKLTASELTLIKKVDWSKREIVSESLTGQKPSFNAGLSAAIFEHFPHIKVIIHLHHLVLSAPTTSFPFTPGTLEYTQEPLELLKKHRLINLASHGLIAIGEDLEETVNYVIDQRPRTN